MPVLGLRFWAESEQTFLHNLNFIAVQIYTQLMSSPLRNKAVKIPDTFPQCDSFVVFPLLRQ